MKKLLLLAMAVVWVGCATDFFKPEPPSSARTPYMESWVGSPKTELYQSRGAPTRTISDGADGEILIWEGHSPYGGKVIRYTHFWADSAGIIYHWKWADYFTGRGATRGTEPQDP